MSPRSHTPVRERKLLTGRRLWAASAVAAVLAAAGIVWALSGDGGNSEAVPVTGTTSPTTTGKPSSTTTPTRSSPDTTSTGSGPATTKATGGSTGAATSSSGGSKPSTSSGSSGTKTTGGSSTGSTPAAPVPGRGTFPGDANTGVSSGKSLEKINGNLVVSTAGKVIDGVDVLGSITVKANNVTIRNARVRCVGVTDFCVAMVGRNGKLQTSEIGGGRSGTDLTSAIGVWSGGDPGFSATNTLISKIDVHHTSDGLRIDGYTTITDSWIHDLSYSNGAHSDGTTNSRGKSVVYRHNTFESGTNCNIFLQQNGGEKISDVMIDSNLLIGVTRQGQETSFGICTDRGLSGIKVHANVFKRGSWQVGPATGGMNWALWSANRYADGALLAKP